MAEEYLFCNYRKCKAPITKFCWITRCSHVFCEEHGNAYFLNKPSKIKCPACNETNAKEIDIIKSNLHPHDMLLCCVKPEKALDYVVNATKLWSYQMKQKRKFNMEYLSEKYEKIASDALLQLRKENNEMKKFIQDLEGQVKIINDQLLQSQKKIWKYKMAYKELTLKNTTHATGNEQLQQHPSFFSDFQHNTIHNAAADDFIQHGRFPKIITP